MDSSLQWYLSVIIPAYNEKNRLRKTLPGLRDFLNQQDFSWEVILVDDGSDDQTSEVLLEFFNGSEVRVLRNSKNQGKGYSVKRGVLAAKGRVVLITDADFSTPIEEFIRLNHYMDAGCKLVIGSRGLPDSNVVTHQVWYREGMGRFFNRLVRLILSMDFEDTQCGFKCFERELGCLIFSKTTVTGFCFDVEFLFIAKKLGIKIIEVPVEWSNVLESRVRILLDPARMFLDLLKIRFKDLMGNYN